MHLEIHENKPEDFACHLEVAGGYLVHDGKFLLLQRPESFKQEPGTWGMPGGKLEKDETPLEAMQRELHEETGIHTPLSSFTPLGHLYFRKAGIDFVFYFFHLPLKERPDVTINEEHADYLWLAPNEFASIDAMAGGEDVMAYIYKQLENHDPAT